VLKNQPEILLCSLQPRQIMYWRARNSWADSIEMIIFTDEDPPMFVKSKFACVAFAEPNGNAPHMCVNAPIFAVPELERIAADGLVGTAERSVDNLERYGNAVLAVARELRGVRCAWIQPESDHAFGACLLASVVGLALAVSQREMIDSLGAIASARLEVNVRTLGTINATRGDA